MLKPISTHSTSNTCNRNSLSTVTVSLLNVHSLTTKSLFIFDQLVENETCIYGLSETWLKDFSTSTRNLSTPANYTFLDNVRPGEKRGGGVALIRLRSLQPKVVNLKTYTTFESITVCCSLPSPFLTTVIYRPPNSELPATKFIDEFSDFLTILCLKAKPYLIMGDFNITKSNITLYNNFFDLLTIFNLSQHVGLPTHNLGNILDFVVTNTNISTPSVIDHSTAISDHFQVDFNLYISGSLKKSVKK